MTPAIYLARIAFAPAPASVLVRHPHNELTGPERKTSRWTRARCRSSIGVSIALASVRSCGDRPPPFAPRRHPWGRTWLASPSLRCSIVWAWCRPAKSAGRCPPMHPPRAVGFARAGHRILRVDMDPRASCSLPAIANRTSGWVRADPGPASTRDHLIAAPPASRASPCLELAAPGRGCIGPLFCAPRASGDSPPDC